MTPRLLKDVLELQNQAKFQYNIIFLAQGQLRKSWQSQKSSGIHFLHFTSLQALKMIFFANLLLFIWEFRLFLNS